LAEETLKTSAYPLGDAGKPLEYLLKHPESAESDNKRGRLHDTQNFQAHL